MGMITGGELVARTLVEAEVGHLFGVYGGHLETVIQSSAAHGIKFIDGRDERSGGHAAEGYARTGRTMGVALATAGPGITNVITSIATAFIDRTPVLYLTASAALAHAAANTVQDIDNVSLARPITKWAHRVTTTRDIPRLLAHAIRIATSGPAGPVLLDFPVDVSFGMVDEDAVTVPKFTRVDSVPAPQPQRVGQALALLSSAKRPVLMAGEGAWASGAADELRTFVETSGIPVFAHYQSVGLLPVDHPLYGGTFFKMVDLSETGGRPDVVLALGTRFGVFTMSPSDQIIPADAKVIQVEVDASEIGRLRDVDVPVVSDSREFLLALREGAKSVKWPDRTEWLETVADAKAARRADLQPLLSGTGTAIHPYRAVSEIAACLDEDTIVIGDGAEAHQWVAEAVHPSRPDRYFTHGQLGTLGMGLGFAIGAQVARPDHRVVLVTGDGAVGFTIAEFDTMVRHDLPIVVVVMNNRMWGATRHFQEMLSGPDHVIATGLADTRYDEVAAAFGCFGANVSEAADLRPTIQKALASGRPACINVEIEFSTMPPDAAILTTSSAW